MFKNFNSVVTFSPLCNSLDCYHKFQVHAEERECITIFSYSRIFLSHMESFSNLMKIPVYDKTEFLIEGPLYVHCLALNYGCYSLGKAFLSN